MANVSFPATIKERFNYPVTVDIAGLYCISISARVKSAKQINGSDDEDLQIEIDGRKFREITPSDKPQYKNIPPAFNGSELKGLKKTVVFFIWLEKGYHIFSLISDHSAIVENFVTEKMQDVQSITLAINEQAEDGDRRPWFAFIFVDLSVKEISASVIARSRWFDRDDAQIKIDGEIQSYKNASTLHRFWYWIGSLFKGKEETAYFKPNLKEGIHYIEINADRMPTLNKVKIVLAENEDGQDEKNQAKNIQSYDLYKGVYGNEDYNRFDKEIIVAVDYWNDFFAKQEYPPPELLDYNLVKAIIYKESRVGYFETDGYPSYPDVMQVGDTDNPALPTLMKVEGYKANEFVSRDERKHLSYSFPEDRLPIRVDEPKESIFWGVRWLYNKAQKQYGTTVGDNSPYIREWKTWKQAVIDYNGSSQKYEYQKLVWRIYKDGIDSDDNTLWETIERGFSLFLAVILFAVILAGIVISYYTGYKVALQKEGTIAFEDDVCYNEEHYTDYSEETREIIEQLFLKNLQEYKKDKYYYGGIFDETIKECEKRHCWMEIVMRGYYNDLVENMKSNKQFLEATKYFDFLDPRVCDIDNDGENEIVFITTDILNNDFVVLNVVDKLNENFKLFEKKLDKLYSAHIELRDLTNDIVSEIILYYSYGRWGDRIAVYQYNNNNFEEIFNNEEFIFPEYIFSDENKNGLAEIKIYGKQFGINPVGDECNACHHTKAEEIYEYNPGKNNFQLIAQKYFGISGALYNVIKEIKQKGENHRLFADWRAQDKDELAYFLKKINKDAPDKLFSDILETSKESWKSLDYDPYDNEVWIKAKRMRIFKESEEMIKNNISAEIINAQGPFYKISFARDGDGNWTVTGMSPILEE